MNDKKTAGNYIMYGAEFSLYSGKLRSYLRKKAIPFREKHPSILTYKRFIVPRTGVRFIPVLQTPDDEVLQENIDGIVFNAWYSKDEVAGIEMYSLSRNAFLFYSDLEITLNNDGGLFSPLPTNPRTNLVGNALGLFQVSAIASDEITIE